MRVWRSFRRASQHLSDLFVCSSTNVYILQKYLQKMDSLTQVRKAECLLNLCDMRNQLKTGHGTQDIDNLHLASSCSHGAGARATMEANSACHRVLGIVRCQRILLLVLSQFKHVGLGASERHSYRCHLGWHSNFGYFVRPTIWLNME